VSDEVTTGETARAIEIQEASELEVPTREQVEDLVGAPVPAGEDAVDPEWVLSAEAVDPEQARLKAMIEAVIYITDEPLQVQQMAAALARPAPEIQKILDELVEDYAQPHRGLSVREVAGGYKMATKVEHHESIRAFVKNLKAPLKLSLAALETLAVIAYKQPITAPEIMEIRGVQGAGVLKTLLDRKLIATAGRKNVIGKPILYKTTREFLVQFGLKDLTELPTLKEFEELGRMALTDSEAGGGPDSEEPAATEADATPGDERIAADPASPADEADPSPTENAAPTPPLEEAVPQSEEPAPQSGDVEPAKTDG
jgi:segregation and condensation protein B